MKRMLLATAVATLVLAPATSFAQPDQHGHRKGHHHGPPAAQHHGHPYRHDNGKHLGWYKQKWRRGQHVPTVYLQPRYYIDYRDYRLQAPPPGYGWVRPYPDSNEYLLVQLATGAIMQVLGY